MVLRSTRLGSALAALSLALVLPAGAAARGHSVRDAPCAGADTPPTVATIPAAQQATLCLVNAERTSRGLHSLRANDRLQKAARGHSQDMVRRAYFDHVSPGGTDPVSRLTKVHYITRTISWSIAENIGWGDGSLSTPRAIVQAWMDSPPHRVNMLNPTYRDAGVGVEIGSPDPAPLPGATYTIDFGRRSR
jgi:uncharacterized protein YkwD